jgi:predicted phosphodiesterase
MIDSRIRIQFVSDIHLEMMRTGYFDPSRIIQAGEAEFLALCGDIGYPEDAILEEFLRFCSTNYRKVFWVPGNHEFYSPHRMTIQEKFKKMESLCRTFPNIILMNQTAVNIAGTPLRIIGCPLWTHIPEDAVSRAEKYMNDFRLIYKTETQRITVDDLNAWHRADRAWIESEIRAAEESGQELVVLTHHLPTQRLVHKKYEGHPLNVCFATSLDSIIRFPIRAWLCGHSHTANEARVNSVLCALNPGGYPGENDDGHDRRKILTVVCKDEESEYSFLKDTFLRGQSDLDTSSSEEE